MMRPVAILKIAPAIPIVAGAVTGGAATGAATGAASTTAAATAGTGIGSALMQGAKKKIGQVGVMDAASIAQNASDKSTERAQQSQQNNIQSSQDLADKAKEKADLTKAWRFDSRLQKPEYADFTDKLIEDAKRNTVSPNEHYKERMGEAGNPNEHRYQGRQPFIHNDKEIDVSPHQIASAFMDHLHTDKSFTDKNHPEDTVHSLQDMFETDTPHHDPYWENRGDEMRRGEDGKMIISNLSPQMIGNPTTGYQSKTATPVQSEYGRHMNRINPIDYATQNEVHDLPVHVRKPKSQVAINREEVGDALNMNTFEKPEDSKSNLDRKRFIDKVRQGWFGNSTGRTQEERQGMMGNFADYNKYTYPKLMESKNQQQQGQQEQQPESKPLRTVDMNNLTPMQQQMLDSGAKIITDALGNQDLKWASEPMDIAMRLLKESVHLTHNEDLPHQFSQDIANLDNRHEIAPTKTGSAINNIHPNMLRTIQLMAENYQDNTPVQEEEYEPPTYF